MADAALGTAMPRTAAPLRRPFAAELRRLWAYREMAWNLASVELRVGRRGTLLGPMWAVLHPLVVILVYYVAFGHIIGYRPVANYPLFIAVGVLHWSFFQGFVPGGCRAVAGQARLLDRADFPRFVLPVAHGITMVGEHLLAMLSLAIVFPFMGAQAWWGFALYPAVLAIAFLFGLGLCLAFSALSVFLPDVQEVAAIVFRMAFFVTPVAFSFDRLPEGWQRLLAWNPFTPFIEAFRDLLYANTLPAASTWGAMLGWTALSLAIGITVFRRLEPQFARWLA